MQAVADALSLLAYLVMAWNTMKMQLVLKMAVSLPTFLHGNPGEP
jgi:hypothetical protein